MPVQRRGNRPARIARVQIRSASIELHPASTHYPERRPLPVNLVEVREIGVPAGLEPLHWRLMTTEPVCDFQQAREVVRLYGLRWSIEELHRTLKSACRIEDVRFHAAERIEIVLAFYGPVAVLIMQLRHYARGECEMPAARILSSEVLDVLYTAVHRRPPAPDMAPPTIRQAILWIGRLGGHLGRKNDGLPGLTTLWRGWRDLWGYVVFARAQKQS